MMPTGLFRNTLVTDEPDTDTRYYERYQARVVQALRDLKASRPQNDEELWYWIWYVLGFAIAWRPVCDEHVAPFQFVADCFFGRKPGVVIRGARGSGKTRSLSTVHLLNSHFDPGFKTAHVGAVQRQGDLCHGYVREYVKDPHFRSTLVKDPLISKTEWRNGSELSILPGTVSATSGPHPNRTVADEFDLMPWEVYQQFIGMAQSSDRYQAQTIYTSAQVTSFGPLARLIAEAPSRGLKVDTFCVLDVMVPCPTCEDAERVKRGVKLDPPDCPIWDYCQGRARNATGHLRREDVIARFLQADEDTWLSQHLCRTTSVKGLVYERFDPTPAELGKTNVSVEAEYNPELPLVLGCDDGFSPDPMSLLACQIQPNGDVWVVDEIFATNRLYEEVLSWIHGTELDAAGVAVDTWPWQEVEWDEVRGARPTGVVRHYRKPSAAYTGPSDKQLQAHLAQLGIPILSPTRTNVLDGIGEVRRVICDARGHRGLVLHPRCKNAIAHLQHYHRRRLPNGEYTAEPADNVGRSNPDDGADSLRYLIAFRLESARVRLTPL